MSDLKSSSSDVLNDVLWPMDSANQVIFEVPASWKNLRKNNNKSQWYCKFQYNVEKRFLQVVDANDPTIIFDVIDVDDVIGANVEIRMKSDDTNSKTNDAGYRPASVTPTSTIHGAYRCSNEPAYDTLSDTSAFAVLSIFVYPREDLSKRSWTSYLFTSNDNGQQQPQPNYQRPFCTNSQPGPPPHFGHRFANHRHFVLRPVEDFQHVQNLVKAIRQLACPYYTSNPNLKGRKYLIIVNPRSGPKRDGVSICESLVQPMLEQAGIDTDVIVTTHPRHAMELASGDNSLRSTKTTKEHDETSDQSCTDDNDVGNDDNKHNDITKYDALIVMGGDGLLHEVLNGIQQRKDGLEILKKLPVGVVGCGTANGKASTLAYASQERFGPINETFLICKGRTILVDFSQYEILEKKQTKHTEMSSTSMIRQYTSFITYTWGLISDIDLESECIHWFGARRFDVWAVWRILWLRRYKGKFSYRAATSGVKNDYSSPPSIHEALPNDWKVIDDEIVLFWASHVTHAGKNTYQAPGSKLQDGIFQILLIRGNISRLRVALILLALETGSHVGMTGAEFIECSAFRLEPDYDHKQNLARKTRNNLDGEAYEDGPIQAYVVPAAYRVFCNPKD